MVPVGVVQGESAGGSRALSGKRTGVSIELDRVGQVAVNDGVAVGFVEEVHLGLLRLSEPNPEFQAERVLKP